MSTNDQDGILKVPRADYLLWCKRRLEHMSDQTSDSNQQAPQQQVLGSRFGHAFPQELLLKIFGYLRDSQSSMYAVSLVCRQWMLCICPLLYKNAQIADTYRWATFILTLTRDKKLFCYGRYVTSIELVTVLPSSKSLDLQNTQITATAQNTTHDTTTTTTTTTTITTTLDAEEYIHNDHIVEDLFTRSNNENESKDIRVLVTTSSLMQVARTCRNLTTINLSMTTIMCDHRIEETGEYVSTLQHHAVQPGLTQTLISVEDVIQALGTECEQLAEVIVQRCEWVTAQIIWLWVTHCPKLVRLDAVRCRKCTAKNLTNSPLVLESEEDFYEEEEEGDSDEEGANDEEGDSDEEGDNDEEGDSDDEGESDEEVSQGHGEPPVLPRWLLVSKIARHERYRSLKQVVYDKLKEAKATGANDLEWFQL